MGVDGQGARGLVLELARRIVELSIEKDDDGEGEGMREVGADAGASEGGSVVNEKAGRLVHWASQVEGCRSQQDHGRSDEHKCTYQESLGCLENV